LRVKGVVKWFNNRKGFGFIRNEDEKDIFVHYTSLMGEGYKTLREGEPVEFEVVEGEKGLQASDVTRVGDKT